MAAHVEVTPYRPVLDAEAVGELRDRLARPRLSRPVASDWSQGVPVDWLRELLADWRGFDFDRLQDRLDALTHVRADLDGQTLHAVIAPGARPDAPPLVLVHGWPGSFLEHVFIAPMLAETFIVVVPSLPGFAFSGPPPAPGLITRQVAALCRRLMTEGLGHDRFVAHGSDIGAGVVAWLARDHSQSVRAIHLATPGLAPVSDATTPEERAYADEVERWAAEEGGYAHEQATKPLTLGAALHDSPAGLAAWIGEKFFAWSGIKPDGTSAFERELLLSTLTLYWVTGTVTSSLLPYWAARHTPLAALPIDDRSPVPTAVSVFGGERIPFPKPPRALAQRYFNVTYWAEHDTGGHFPAVAAPDLLAQTLREVLAPKAR
jgi:pimeloyl-ACP methyl ester carboxylesterase